MSAPSKKYYVVSNDYQHNFTLNHAISFLFILRLRFAVNIPQLFAFSLR